MRSTPSLFLYFLMPLFLLTACKKDDPVIPNEEEIITRLTFTLTPTDGGSPVVLSFQDLDGDGGAAPEIIVAPLPANQTFTGKLELWSEQGETPEDITAEIMEEDEDHQFFFQTTLSGLNITYSDQDANGHPIGLATQVQTGAAESGSLTVILKHEPNKAASGVANGDVSNAGGETDIEVTFPIDVE